MVELGFAKWCLLPELRCVLGEERTEFLTHLLQRHAPHALDLEGAFLVAEVEAAVHVFHLQISGVVILKRHGADHPANCCREGSIFPYPLPYLVFHSDWR